MNVLLLKEEELQKNNRVIIEGERFLHLKNVLKVVPGKLIKIGLINKGFTQGLVHHIIESCVEIEVLRDFEVAGKDIFSNVCILLAMPRPQSLKKVLELIGTLGVGELIIIDSDRVEKSYFNSKVILSENIEKHLLLGMEQGVVINLPKVSILKDSTVSNLKNCNTEHSKYINDKILNSSVKILAHPESKKTLGSFYKSKNDLLEARIILAIGPEGGWWKREIEFFRENNFDLFNLSKRILRVETALTFFLAQLDLIQND